MKPVAQRLSSTPFQLQVRKEVRFDFSTLENVIHTEDNLYISHVFNALSLVTPITEGILIRAIRESLPMLEGSDLESDAKAFIGQEAIHTREHRALNRRLFELGIDIETTFPEIEREVNRLESRMTLQQRLAIVITGEHAIYSVARALLISNYPQCQQHENVKELFIWHAAEEMEHQSVCDDIYQHLYGKGISHKLLYYRLFITTAKLLVTMINSMMTTLLEQSRKPHKGEMKKFITWLLSNRAIGPIAFKELAGFFSPGFAHWRRHTEDQQLISDNLGSVYGGNIT